jgi:hypothetical protein
MTTNVATFTPITVKLSNNRKLEISVDPPGEHPATVTIRADTYQSRTGDIKTFSLRISMRSLGEFLDALNSTEEYGVRRGWIAAPVNEDAATGDA